MARVVLKLARLACHPCGNVAGTSPGLDLVEYLFVQERAIHPEAGQTNRTSFVPCRGAALQTAIK
ncbi:MAG: hypothetical protein NVSMB62_20820 [Acidobacteriaceae bacterium]